MKIWKFLFYSNHGLHPTYGFRGEIMKRNKKVEKEGKQKSSKQTQMNISTN